MGIHIDLITADLRCRSEASAHAAAAIIHGHAWMSPYHVRVSVHPPSATSAWRLVIDHFQGDHWHEDESRAVWLALTPYMANGATIEFEGPGYERWRIRWAQGRVFEDITEEVRWTVAEEITPPDKEAP